MAQAALRRNVCSSINSEHQQDDDNHRGHRQATMTNDSSRQWSCRPGRHQDGGRRPYPPSESSWNWKSRRPQRISQKAHLCLFSVFLFLSPSTFFGLPLFPFLFLCLSLALVFFFLSSLSFFFAFFGSFFFSLSNFSFFFALFSEIKNCMLFFSSIFSLFLWFPVLFFSFKSLFHFFAFFSWYSVMFFVEHQCFGFKKHKLRNTNFWSKGELQQNGFFLITCVLKNVKSYRFCLPLFWPNFGWC